MKVKFSFDRVAVERQGYTMRDAYRTAKELFTAHDLPCVSDGAVLVFDDFAVMWVIILALLRADWFLDCAVSCVWQDEDGEEDVLVQAGKVRGIRCQ